MRVLDLFSGIGGFSLGLERTGMRTVAFCEIDPYCRAVLAKHWPHVPIYEDITKFAGVPCDVICGGFPCQDISSAGYKAGITGDRSRLWEEFARLVGEIRPRYIIVENSAALLARGLGKVLGDLAALGYDAEWHCIPASAVGAFHGRDRCWIVGYPNSDGESGLSINAETPRSSPVDSHTQCRLGPLGRYMGGNGWQRELLASIPWLGSPEDQPDFLGVVHGLPSRMDRLRALGNSLVPQIPEIIGRAIMNRHPAEDKSND